MADVLAELVAKITADATELKKALAESENAVEKTGSTIKDKVESIKKAISGISTAWVGVGAALVGSMGLMAKASADEEANVKNLAATLKGVGVEYDNVKDSLEGVIAATQRKTGIADSEQRDTLSRLLLVTKDYNKALDLLPLALDLAAAGQMDVNSAATSLGKAFLELEQGADKIGIRMGTTIVYFKDLAEVQKLVGGRAAEVANPFKVLTTEIGDMGEKIGSVLLPIVKDLIGKFIDVIDKIKIWTDANPELVKALAAGALAVSGLIAMVFALKAALILLGTTANLYFGGILILIGALVTAGVLLWQNWDKVSHFFADAWSNMKNAALHAIDAMLNGLEKFLGWIPGIGDKIRSAHDAIANMIDAPKVARDAQAMTSTIKTELEKQKADALSSLESKKRIAQDGFNAATKAIKEEYGEYKTTTKNKMDLAKDASNAERKALEDGLKQARRVHDETISLLEKEYDQRIRTLNAEADYQIASIQKQIDAIDAKTEAEDRANRITELQANITNAKTAEDKKQAEEELARFLLLDQREKAKDALRAQIDAIRNNTQLEEDRLQKELDSRAKTLDSELKLFEDNQNKINDALDEALIKELKRLDDERIGKETLEKSKLEYTLNTLAREEESINTSFTARLTDAAVYQAALEATLKDVNRTVTTTYVSRYVGSGGGGGGGEVPSGKSGVPEGETSIVPGFQQGGIVQNTGLAYLHEGETVIPANEGGGGNISVNFTQPVFFDREETMNKFVDMVRKGIQRQDRLRFGGAYNG